MQENIEKKQKLDKSSDNNDTIIQKQEENVGISAYLHHGNTGFYAVLKSRFADFLVNEISIDGQVARLSSLEKSSNETEIEKFVNVSSPLDATTEENIAKLCDNDGDQVKIDDITDKEARTNIHKYIKATYPFLNSTTVDGSIVIRKQVGKPKRAREQTHKFMIFTMYKENRDTHDAVNTIARLLRINTKVFGYAGIKDKRGKTTQFVTAHNVPEYKLRDISSKLLNIRISDFKPYHKDLHLGDLSGNLFTIVLRDLPQLETTTSQADLENSIQSLSKGFINYYGMQRFGSSAYSRTDSIGKLLLQEKYKEACDMILGVRPEDKENESDSLKARLEWQKTKDPETVLRMFPTRNIAERSILESLKSSPDNWLNAIMRIPRNLRLMYVHAYQSLIWNKCVTARLNFGHLPMVGDLVQMGDQVETINTEEDALRYEISNVVLPMPGSSICYPTNAIRDIYKDLLEADSLDLSLNHKQKDFDLKGDYRKIVVVPQNFSYSFIRYNDPEANLTLSDADIVDGVPEPVTIPDGKHLGAILKFSLPSSSYATMAIREITRMETFVHGIPSIYEPIEHDNQYEYFAVSIHSPTSEQIKDERSIFKRALDFTLGTPVENLHMRHYFKSIEELAQLSGFEVIAQIGDLAGHFLVRKYRDEKFKDEVVKSHLLQLKGHSSVKWALHQSHRQRKKRSVPLNQALESAARKNIHDPAFGEQWHLINRINRNADINVTGVWDLNITGEGVVSAMIDDGVDMYNDDLKDNFFLNGSYDFNLRSKLPLPRLEDDVHGTRCAGEIAASINSICGVGVAFKGKVSGIRILGGPITDVDEALAINYGYQENHIYSCSWGPSDDGKHVEGPNELVTSAIVNGIRNGRGGLGSIFVFATGNGGFFDDNCNYDGYTNSIYGISIGAIDSNNQHPYYSEKCSAHLAVTYSSGDREFIHTTDIRPQNCTGRHGGTSAAAPLAVGILALALSIRPDLSYRDMQYITIRGAEPIDLGDDGWEETYAKRKYSHKYGYGKLDAYKIVQVAKDWKNVGPQRSFHAPVFFENENIPFGENGLKVCYNVTREDVEKNHVFRVEHVTVGVNITHGKRGDLDFYLISPHDITSYIGPHRALDNSREGFQNWTFSSVKHWEEDAVGLWCLLITDKFNPLLTGELISWQLSIYGEGIAGSGPFYPSTNNGNSSNLDTSHLGIIIGGVLVFAALLIGGILFVFYSTRDNSRNYVLFEEQMMDEFINVNVVDRMDEDIEEEETLLS